jgi:hypothetical protein
MLTSAMLIAVILGATVVNDTCDYYYCIHRPKYVNDYNDLPLVAIVTFLVVHVPKVNTAVNSSIFLLGCLHVAVLVFLCLIVFSCSCGIWTTQFLWKFKVHLWTITRWLAYIWFIKNKNDLRPSRLLEPEPGVGPPEIGYIKNDGAAQLFF